jgi:hypothetical protein
MLVAKEKIGALRIGICGAERRAGERFKTPDKPFYGFFDYRSPMANKVPTEGAGSFRCPHCRVYSEQRWQNIKYHMNRGHEEVGSIARCTNCTLYSVWIEGDMFYPKASTAPNAHEEMPDEVKRDFDEARLVVEDSPRAAAALLRLAIQRLVDDELEADGGRLYDQIGNLVEDGVISERIQRALDAVRVIGNNSVHPGEMDMDDNRDTAEVLFTLLNEIVDEAIAREKRINAVYQELPEGAVESIEDRDGE